MQPSSSDPSLEPCWYSNQRANQIPHTQGGSTNPLTGWLPCQAALSYTDIVEDWSHPQNLLLRTQFLHQIERSVSWLFENRPKFSPRQFQKQYFGPLLLLVRRCEISENKDASLNKKQQYILSRWSSINSTIRIIYEQTSMYITKTISSSSLTTG